MTNQKVSNIDLQPIFKELLNDRYNLFIYKSGRAAGKSWSICTILLMKALKKKMRILCCREHGTKLQSSVKAQLETNIAQLELSDYFDIQDKKIICKPTGSKFFFTGLQEDPTGIQGFADIQCCFVDEGQAISWASWRKLKPTIMRNKGSIIIVAMNPELEHDCLYQESINPVDPARTYVAETSYKENKYLPESMLQGILSLKEKNYQEYRHVYGGELVSNSDRQIFQNIQVSNLDHLITPEDSMYVGIDYGFTDPMCYLGVYYFKDTSTIYIAHEFYQTQVAWEQIIPNLERTIPGVRQCKIITDTNEKRITKFLRDNGFNVSCAIKGNNSVLEGIKFFQSHSLVINERCKNAVREFSSAVWDVDKVTEKPKVNVISKTIDDHAIAAARYALEAQRRRYTSSLYITKGTYKPAMLFTA